MNSFIKQITLKGIFTLSIFIIITTALSACGAPADDDNELGVMEVEEDNEVGDEETNITISNAFSPIQTNTDLTATIDISESVIKDVIIELSTNISDEALANLNNGISLEESNLTLVVPDMSYTLVKDGRDNSCSTSIQSSNIIGSGASITITLNITSILTRGCSGDNDPIRPNGYANLEPFDMIKNININGVTISIQGTDISGLDKEHFLGVVPIDGEIIIIGDETLRSPFFAKDSYSLFILNSQLPAAGQLLTTINASFADNYTISYSFAGNSSIIFNASNGEVSYNKSFDADLANLVLPKVFTYTIMANNRLTSVSVELTITLLDQVRFAEAAYQVLAYRGAKGRIYNASFALAEGYEANDYGFTITDRATGDGQDLFMVLTDNRGELHLHSTGFLGENAGTAIFQGQDVPDTYNLTLTATSDRYPADTASINLTVNVQTVPYRFETTYNAGNGGGEIATLNSVYNRQYNVRYEILADSSDGDIRVIDPASFTTNPPDYAQADITTTAGMPKDEHTLIVREIIESGTGDNLQTHYGSDNGTVMIIHVRGDGGTTRNHFINFWPKSNLGNTSFTNIGSMDINLGDNLLFMCADPDLENDIPTIFAHYLVNQTHAETCYVDGVVNNRPSRFNSCLTHADDAIETERYNLGIQGVSENLESSQAFMAGETTYLTSFLSASSPPSNDLGTTKGLFIGQDNAEPLYSNIPDDSLCNQYGFRMRFDIRP